MIKTIYKFATLIFASAMMLSACSSIPITNIPKLMRLDPETINIGDVEMAIRLRDGFRIQDKGAVLKISIENEASAEKYAGRFILEASTEPLTPFLLRKQKDGYVVHRFTMTEEAVARATKLRENAYKMRENSKGNKSTGKNSATISASAKFCLKPGANPFTDIRLTFFIRTDPQKKFYTLFKERKLSIKGGDGKIRYCEGAAR